MTADALSFDCAIADHDACDRTTWDQAEARRAWCDCDCHPEPDTCTYVLYRGSDHYDASNFGPDDVCPEVALPGSDYCDEHQGWDR